MAGLPKILVWGTYDLGKPRVRILLKGLREKGVECFECHSHVWHGVEDKSQLHGFSNKLRFVGRWVISYPRLIKCYLRAPAHDLVLVPYLGHLDVLALWPFVRLRGSKVVWDAFLSLYDTIVEDRKMIGARNPLAWLLYASEWLATRAADRIFLDTRAHADYFKERYRLNDEKLGVVFVGAESDKFAKLPPLKPKPQGEPFLILFYGQFIPLHGIQTIVRAAHHLNGENLRWILIGSGQDEPRIREALRDHPVEHLEWYPWVDYADLIDWIRRADVCLGIFSDSGKAARVIPNKVFQVLAAGRPLVTRDSPALRELMTNTETGVYLVPASNPAALADAVLQARSDRNDLAGKSLFTSITPRLTETGVAEQLLACLTGFEPRAPKA